MKVIPINWVDSGEVMGRFGLKNFEETEVDNNVIFALYDAGCDVALMHQHDGKIMLAIDKGGKMFRQR